MASFESPRFTAEDAIRSANLRVAPVTPPDGGAQPAVDPRLLDTRDGWKRISLPSEEELQYRSFSDLRNMYSANRGYFDVWFEDRDLLLRAALRAAERERSELVDRTFSVDTALTVAKAPVTLSRAALGMVGEVAKGIYYTGERLAQGDASAPAAAVDVAAGELYGIAQGAVAGFDRRTGLRDLTPNELLTQWTRQAELQETIAKTATGESGVMNELIERGLENADRGFASLPRWARNVIRFNPAIRTIVPQVNFALDVEEQMERERAAFEGGIETMMKNNPGMTPEEARTRMSEVAPLRTREEVRQTILESTRPAIRSAEDAEKVRVMAEVWDLTNFFPAGTAVRATAVPAKRVVREAVQEGAEQASKQATQQFLERTVRDEAGRTVVQSRTAVGAAELSAGVRRGVQEARAGNFKLAADELNRAFDTVRASAIKVGESAAAGIDKSLLSASKAFGGVGKGAGWASQRLWKHRAVSLGVLGAASVGLVGVGVGAAGFTTLAYLGLLGAAHGARYASGVARLGLAAVAKTPKGRAAILKQVANANADLPTTAPLVVARHLEGLANAALRNDSELLRIAAITARGGLRATGLIPTDISIDTLANSALTWGQIVGADSLENVFEILGANAGLGAVATGSMAAASALPVVGPSIGRMFEQGAPAFGQLDLELRKSVSPGEFRDILVEILKDDPDLPVEANNFHRKTFLAALGSVEKPYKAAFAKAILARMQVAKMAGTHVRFTTGEHLAEAQMMDMLQRAAAEGVELSESDVREASQLARGVSGAAFEYSPTGYNQSIKRVAYVNIDTLLTNSRAPEAMVETLVHEIGHTIFDSLPESARATLREQVKALRNENPEVFQEFADEYNRRLSQEDADAKIGDDRMVNEFIVSHLSLLLDGSLQKVFAGGDNRYTPLHRELTHVMRRWLQKTPLRKLSVVSPKLPGFSSASNAALVGIAEGVFRLHAQDLAKNQPTGYAAREATFQKRLDTLQSDVEAAKEAAKQASSGLLQQGEALLAQPPPSPAVGAVAAQPTRSDRDLPQAIQSLISERPQVGSDYKATQERLRAAEAASLQSTRTVAELSKSIEDLVDLAEAAAGSLAEVPAGSEHAAKLKSILDATQATLGSIASMVADQPAGAEGQAELFVSSGGGVIAEKARAARELVRSFLNADARLRDAVHAAATGADSAIPTAELDATLSFAKRHSEAIKAIPGHARRKASSLGAELARVEQELGITSLEGYIADLLDTQSRLLAQLQHLQDAAIDLDANGRRLIDQASPEVRKEASEFYLDRFNSLRELHATLKQLTNTYAKTFDVGFPALAEFSEAMERATSGDVSDISKATKQAYDVFKTAKDSISRLNAAEALRKAKLGVPPELNTATSIASYYAKADIKTGNPDADALLGRLSKVSDAAKATLAEFKKLQEVVNTLPEAENAHRAATSGLANLVFLRDELTEQYLGLMRQVQQRAHSLYDIYAENMQDPQRFRPDQAKELLAEIEAADALVEDLRKQGAAVFGDKFAESINAGSLRYTRLPSNVRLTPPVDGNRQVDTSPEPARSSLASEAYRLTESYRELQEALSWLDENGNNPELISTVSLRAVTEMLDTIVQTDGVSAPFRVEYQNVRAEEFGADRRKRARERSRAGSDPVGVEALLPSELRARYGAVFTPVTANVDSDGGALYISGWSQDKLIHNFLMLVGDMKSLAPGQLELLPAALRSTSPESISYMLQLAAAYQRNLTNGYAGDGSTLAKVSGLPWEIPYANTGYVPEKIGLLEADFINLLLGLQPPVGALQNRQAVFQQQAAQMLELNRREPPAPANLVRERGQTRFEPSSAGVTDPNPLRRILNQARIDTSRMHSVWETRRADRFFKVERVDVGRGDSTAFSSGSYILSRAGFMPKHESPKKKDVPAFIGRRGSSEPSFAQARRMHGAAAAYQTVFFAEVLGTARLDLDSRELPTDVRPLLVVDDLTSAFRAISSAENFDVLGDTLARVEKQLREGFFKANEQAEKRFGAGFRSDAERQARVEVGQQVLRQAYSALRTRSGELYPVSAAAHAMKEAIDLTLDGKWSTAAARISELRKWHDRVAAAKGEDLQHMEFYRGFATHPELGDEAHYAVVAPGDEPVVTTRDKDRNRYTAHFAGRGLASLEYSIDGNDITIRQFSQLTAEDAKPAMVQWLRGQHPGSRVKIEHVEKKRTLSVKALRASFMPAQIESSYDPKGRRSQAKEAAMTQRGIPETVMMSATRAILDTGVGSGMLGHALEHVGDLSHRAQEGFGVGNVAAKVRDAMRNIPKTSKELRASLEDSSRMNAAYRLAREMGEEDGAHYDREWLAKNAAEIERRSKEQWKVTEEQLKAYAEAHRQHNEPVTQAGVLGKEAAIALAELRAEDLHRTLGELDAWVKEYEAQPDEQSADAIYFRAPGEDRATVNERRSDLARWLEKSRDTSVFYHGSPALNITEFSAPASGIYFTKDREYAESYARGYGQVYETYLRFENPIDALDPVDFDKLARAALVPEEIYSPTAVARAAEQAIEILPKGEAESLKRGLRRLEEVLRNGEDSYALEQVVSRVVSDLEDAALSAETENAAKLSELYQQAAYAPGFDVAPTRARESFENAYTSSDWFSYYQEDFAKAAWELGHDAVIGLDQQETTVTVRDSSQVRQLLKSYRANFMPAGVPEKIVEVQKAFDAADGLLPGGARLNAVATWDEQLQSIVVDAFYDPEQFKENKGNSFERDDAIVEFAALAKDVADTNDTLIRLHYPKDLEDYVLVDVGAQPLGFRLTDASRNGDTPDIEMLALPEVLRADSPLVRHIRELMKRDIKIAHNMGSPQGLAKSIVDDSRRELSDPTDVPSGVLYALTDALDAVFIVVQAVLKREPDVPRLGMSLGAARQRAVNRIDRLRYTDATAPGDASRARDVTKFMARTLQLAASNLEGIGRPASMHARQFVSATASTLDHIGRNFDDFLRGDDPIPVGSREDVEGVVANGFVSGQVTGTQVRALAREYLGKFMPASYAVTRGDPANRRSPKSLVQYSLGRVATLTGESLEAWRKKRLVADAVIPVDTTAFAHLRRLSDARDVSHPAILSAELEAVLLKGARDKSGRLLLPPAANADAALVRSMDLPDFRTERQPSVRLLAESDTDSMHNTLTWQEQHGLLFEPLPQTAQRYDAYKPSTLQGYESRIYSLQLPEAASRGEGTESVPFSRAHRHMASVQQPESLNLGWTREAIVTPDAGAPSQLALFEVQSDLFQAFTDEVKEGSSETWKQRLKQARETASGQGRARLDFLLAFENRWEEAMLRGVAWRALHEGHSHILIPNLADVAQGVVSAVDIEGTFGGEESLSADEIASERAAIRVAVEELTSTSSKLHAAINASGGPMSQRIWNALFLTHRTHGTPVKKAPVHIARRLIKATTTLANILGVEPVWFPGGVAPIESPLAMIPVPGNEAEASARNERARILLEEKIGDHNRVKLF